MREHRQYRRVHSGCICGAVPPVNTIVPFSAQSLPARSRCNSRVAMVQAMRNFTPTFYLTGKKPMISGRSDLHKPQDFCNIIILRPHEFFDHTGFIKGRPWQLPSHSPTHTRVVPECHPAHNNIVSACKSSAESTVAWWLSQPEYTGE
jgi:hypothetical protein